ncbi:MAG: triose-phosphate isomerase [Candidatus Binatia bacterium]|nr:triose-phosphate isomerase [Candidatus Binatia bacterium]
MARKPILAGNWKMHGSNADAKALASGLAANVGNRDDRGVILSPPFTALATTLEAVRGTSIIVAAQNMHFEEKGAFTGEISPTMLQDLGITHVILGHSERREVFGESDELINKKVASALAHDLTAILCVGETLEQRDAGDTIKVITGQVKAGLTGVTAAQCTKIVLAYEPVWAIGTGRVATPEQAQEVHAQIRTCVSGLGLPGDDIAILYGGSVKPDNVDGLMACPDIDGALVGGASLKVEDFTRIVEFQG